MSPDCSRDGRSICVLSPVMTALEFTPRRVKNIFICALVAFCDSSRMTNASASVRPRMYASGAISIVRVSSARCTRSGGIMSSSASYSGRRYGSTLACMSPGRKPKLSPASTAGPPRRVLFPRARRPDPDHDVVVGDELQVGGLPRRLGLDDAPHAREGD